MANLAIKNGTYVIRFRYAGKEYKRSLKTRSGSDAEAAKNSVELTIHRLLTGFLKLPVGIDTGDFIVSGGALTEPARRAEEPPPLPTTRSLVAEYLDSQKNMLAESYRNSQKIHLGHFTKHLGDLVNAACNKVTRQHIEKFLYARLAIRDSNTVARERVTLIQFYKWVCSQESLSSYSSPASKLFTIKCGRDRDPFRTPDEIKQIIERGGMTEDKIMDLWECLYLNPQEIGELLATVRTNAVDSISFMLHAIPAYTGMRRGEVLRLTWIDVDLDNGYVSQLLRADPQTLQHKIARVAAARKLAEICWKRLRHWHRQHNNQVAA